MVGGKNRVCKGPAPSESRSHLANLGTSVWLTPRGGGTYGRPGSCPGQQGRARRPASQHGESGLQHAVTEGLIGRGIQEQTGVSESPVHAGKH